MAYFFLCPFSPLLHFRARQVHLVLAQLVFYFAVERFMMRYTEILQKAFATAWKYKYLWVLGFFADITTFFGFTGEWRERVPPHFWHRFADFDHVGLLAGVSILLMFLVFIVVVAFIILERIAEGGLIANAANIRRDQPHNLSTAWNMGFKYFLRMMGVLLCQIVLIFVYIIIFAGFMIIVGVGIGGPVLLLCLIFVIPAFFSGIFLISIVFSYAERFVVVEDRGVFESIGSGLDLLKRKFGQSVAMGFIAVLVIMAITFALVVLFLMLAVPLVGLYLINPVLGVLFGIFIILPPVVLITAYLGVYRSCLWTFFFMELQGRISAPPTPPAPEFE